MARATFDLQCPAPQIELIELDERSRGARGCMKQLTYVEICDNRPDGWRCTWVINSPAWMPETPQHGKGTVPPNTWWITKPDGSPTNPGQAGPGPAGPGPAGPGPSGPSAPPPPSPPTVPTPVPSPGPAPVPQPEGPNNASQNPSSSEGPAPAPIVVPGAPPAPTPIPIQ